MMAPPALQKNLESDQPRQVTSVITGYLSIVVLGASGDLAKRKTFPAIFNLYTQGFLPDELKIIGYSRSKMTTEELHTTIRGYLKADRQDPTKKSEDVIHQFLSKVTYMQGAYDTDEGYIRMNEEVSRFELEKDDKDSSTHRLYYFALPPSVYPEVSEKVRKHCMNPRGWTRVIVEKPFGKDLESSEALSSELGALFTEEQLYRIDHYLGKEMVQNLLIMRFANRFFQPIWNRDNIAHVQIVFKEDFGTEGRGGYFDEYGIIRDIIQNHLVQVLCLVAMEKPVSLSPEHIRDEKVKVLQCVEPINEEQVVIGQYEGYTDDPTVAKSSNTPTFASLALRINNERWDGVPFIVKAGKALDAKKVEIRVQFRDTPGDIFNCKKLGRNEFVMRLQPKEAMYMKLTVKEPGLDMKAIQSELDMSYNQRYEEVVIPEAYERLILDTIRGDQQHFVRRDELRVAWEIFTPLLHRIDAGKIPLLPYKQGSRGPREADELNAQTGYVRSEGYIWKSPTN